MQRKYFILDKNQLLKSVQAEHKEELLHYLVSQVKKSYIFQSNPLGLVDDTILKIRAYRYYQYEYLEEFYDSLAGIFRYHIGTNQLEFLFDGMTHEEKYTEDWNRIFKKWTRDFCQNKHFQKGVLAATVFLGDEHSGLLAENRIKYFLSNYFDLKIYRYKGIIDMKVAS